MIYVVVLLAYSLLVTLVLVIGHFRKSGNVNATIEAFLEAINHEDSITEKTKAMASLSEFIKSTLPWYEKSLSTIGVIGFFSMSIAVGVQTITANTQQYRAEVLKSEIENLKTQKVAAEEFVEDVSSAILSGSFDSRKIGIVESKILRYRYQNLSQASQRDSNSLSELFSLALVLKEYSTAVEILEENKDLLDTSRPSDLLTLAEYYYLVGSHRLVKDMIDGLITKHSMHSRPYIKRYIVLKLAVGISSIEYEKEEFANIFGISNDEAKDILMREVKIIKNALVNHKI